MTHVNKETEILTILKKYWGYDSLRDGQLDILQSVLSGRDTIAILPTGGGKSLCYQLPALLNKKVTLVVSPLLALMKDQAFHLTQIGVNTICLNSELKALDQLRALNELATYEIIYVTPEFLLTHPKVITNLIAAGKLGMLAIDEAHCASSWGHDFRPSYLRLGEMKALIMSSLKTAPKTPINVQNVQNVPKNVPKIISNKGQGLGFGSLSSTLLKGVEDEEDEEFQGEDAVTSASAPLSNASVPLSNASNASNPSNTATSIIKEVEKIPILALTATAPPSVIKDIAKILKLENPATIIGDLGRKNLIIKCLRKTNNKNPALDLYKIVDPSQNTIIYTIKRDETDLIYDNLASLNPSLVKDAKPKMAKYHADLSQDVKHDIYTKFISGEITILIATIAFGMGIDKKDIRTIINWGAPSNLETYYQEIGRAGRDGALSTCYLFWSDADLNLSRFHATSHSTGPLAKESLRKINAMENYLRSSDCRIGIIIRYLRAEFNIDSTSHPLHECLKCDNCVASYSSSSSSGVSGVSGTSGKILNLVDYGPSATILFDVMKNLPCNFGATMIIAILRGSNSQRMTEKLRKLKSYGKGINRTDKWWKSFIKFLLEQNYIAKTATSIQGHLVELLELTPRAISWLNKNDGTLLLREDKELMPFTKSIRSDPVLNPILVSNMLTSASVEGKVEGKVEVPIKVPTKAKSISKFTPTVQETIDQIISGYTISQVAKNRTLNSSTIENHFTMALEQDRELKKYFTVLGLNEGKIETLQKEMKAYEDKNLGLNLSQQKLKEIKDLFNSYSYFEIKVALVMRRN